MSRLTAFVTIEARERDRTDELAALLDRMARVAARDPGTEVWDVNRVADHPARFRIYERYTDLHAVRRHRADAALAALNVTLDELATVTELVPAVLVTGAEQRRGAS